MRRLDLVGEVDLREERPQKMKVDLGAAELAREGAALGDTGGEGLLGQTGHLEEGVRNERSKFGVHGDGRGGLTTCVILAKSKA